MRIIAGVFKGRRLVTPRGATTRPTADQVRIGLMDALRPRLPDARGLVLFAGAGGVGLEALSRGAAHATFVERDPRAVEALDENIRTLGVESRAVVARGGRARQLRPPPPRPPRPPSSRPPRPPDRSAWSPAPSGRVAPPRASSGGWRPAGG